MGSRMGSDPNFPLPSYSAFGEDRLIEYLLRHRSQGFYVDVGCCWPVDYSNTYLLYQHGWRGIAIDADPAVIKDFPTHRPRDICLHAAVGIRHEIVALHRFSDASMNTTNLAWARAAIANPHKRPIDDIKVESWPLSELLDRHMPEATTIDFMNIDCEGDDLSVLRSNNWNRFAPELLAVEDKDLDLDHVTDSAIYRYLRVRSYKLIGRLHLTALYRRG